MCCRITVTPFDRNIAEAALRIGQFEQRDHWVWRRMVEGEGYVDVQQGADGELIIMLSPVISAAEHHLNKRVIAGIAFEIASKYAAHVNGEVRQIGRIASCGGQTELIAVYPDEPLRDWHNICPGFRAIMDDTSPL